MELKGMAKAVLEPGQTRTVRFTLDTDAFTFLGQDLEPVLEAGEILLLVGPTADRSTLKEIRIGVRAT
jgi:beta-glucosidase